MRELTKDVGIQLDDGEQIFRIRKMEAFSGICLLRYLFRLEEEKENPTVLDLIASLSDAELKSVYEACLGNIEIVMPAGGTPIMVNGVFMFKALEHNLAAAMRLLVESIAWNLNGFFREGGSKPEPAKPSMSS